MPGATRRHYAEIAQAADSGAITHGPSCPFRPLICAAYGAAAHLIAVEDTVIVIGYRLMSDDEAREFRPRVVHVDGANRIVATGVDPAVAVGAGVSAPPLAVGHGPRR